MSQWYFRDRANQIQGPFGDEEMRAWYEAGYLAADLLICNGNPRTVQMKPLQVWFPNAALAFLQQKPAASSQNATTASTPQVPHQWYFVDKNQKVQGPFSDVQMRQWHMAGYFAPDLQIIDQSDPNSAQWTTIRAAYPNISDAFLGAAATAAAAQQSQAAKTQAKAQEQVDLKARFTFPDWLPVPPPYKGVKKIYPSEKQGKTKVGITDVHGQKVSGFSHARSK